MYITYTWSIYSECGRLREEAALKNRKRLARKQDVFQRLLLHMVAELVNHIILFCAGDVKPLPVPGGAYLFQADFFLFAFKKASVSS